MADLEKRVEWLEMQMRLVHRTLDKIDRKTEPQYDARMCITCKYNPWVSKVCRVCKEGDKYEPQTESSPKVPLKFSKSSQDEPQTDCVKVGKWYSFTDYVVEMQGDGKPKEFRIEPQTERSE